MIAALTAAALKVVLIGTRRQDALSARWAGVDCRPFVHRLDWRRIGTAIAARFQLYYDTAAAEKAFRPELANQASMAAQLHH